MIDHSEEAAYDYVDTSKYNKYDVMMDDLVDFREASTGASKAEQVMAELDMLSDEEDEN
jgi:hypothetical protein